MATTGTTGPRMAEPVMVLDGLASPEGPRWHGDRLWFAHFADRTVNRLGPDGKRDPSRVAVGGGSVGLAKAGVPVEAGSWAGHLHGSFGIAGPVPDKAAKYDGEIISTLSGAYDTSLR